MPETGSSLATLADQLRSDSTSQAAAAAAAWDVLQLGERFADAMAWKPGVDTIQAMAAAHSCREARRYLRVPDFGQPANTPPAEPRRAADFARLLTILTNDADRLAEPGTSHQVEVHAAAAQQAFTTLAESWRTTG